jgi:ribonuclease P protein component
MLAKKNRADKKNVDLVFKNGRFLNLFLFSIRFFIQDSKKEAKISVIVPKNIAKLAVKRNRLRRITYGVLKDLIKFLPKGLVGVILFKKYEEDSSLIKNEIEKIFDKLN